jgi:hypothetical protein
VRIDIHAHYTPPSMVNDLGRFAEEEPYWGLLITPDPINHTEQGWATPERMIEDMDQTGIDMVVLLGESQQKHSNCVTRNTQGLDIARRWPELVIFKTLALVLILPVAIFTTEVNNMIVGMVRARIPYKLVFIFSSTIRFFPLLFEEIQMIIEAQRLRGLAMEKMGPIKRVRVYAKVAIPLILGAMVKSQALEVVLQSKAFTGSSERTYLHESILTPLDWSFIIMFVTLFLLAAVLYVAIGFGRFGWFLYF